MCQLLGMNCNVPTDICFSFRGFHQRGGRTGDHADGFGVAFFEGPGCRMFVDARPAVNSPVAELIANYPIRSQNVIAHIRKATKGEVALVNTHPFMRELWGRYWIFAHNGTLENFHPDFGNHYRPVGTTDSEQALCYLLDTLRLRYPEGQPPLPELYGTMATLSAEIARYGRFNYILSNGDYLCAAPCAVRDRASEGSGHRSGFQRSHDPDGPHCGDRHRAIDRQRDLDEVCTRSVAGVPRRRAAFSLTIGRLGAGDKSVRHKERKGNRKT